MTGTLAALVLFSFGGCGQPSREQLVQEQVAAMNEVTSVLNTIQDDATADAALPRLEKAANRLATANDRSERAANSQPQPKDADQAMKQLNDPQIQQVLTQLMEAGLTMATAEMQAEAKAPGKAAQLRAVLQKVNKTKSGGGAR
jgi:hypothetical protein